MGVEKVSLLKLHNREIAEKYVLIYIQYWHPLNKSFSVAIQVGSFPQTRFTLWAFITGENMSGFCNVIFSSIFLNVNVQFYRPEHSKHLFSVTKRPEHWTKLRDFTFLL